MGESVTVVWDEDLRSYDFGPGHPLAPIRVQLAMRLTRDLGVLAAPGVHVLSPVELATLEDIRRVHDPDYIEAVRRASADPTQIDLARGSAPPTTPSSRACMRRRCMWRGRRWLRLVRFTPDALGMR